MKCNRLWWPYEVTIGDRTGLQAADEVKTREIGGRPAMAGHT
jgi:hypothetical protein